MRRPPGYTEPFTAGNSDAWCWSRLRRTSIGDLDRGSSWLFRSPSGGLAVRLTNNSRRKSPAFSTREFGAEGEWEGSPPFYFGEMEGSGWSELQRRAIDEMGADTIPNLAALGEQGRGVYLPAQVQTIALPLSAGEPLKCASLLGLRNELSELAGSRGLPLDDDGLEVVAGRTRSRRRLGRGPAGGRDLRPARTRGQRGHAP